GGNQPPCIETGGPGEWECSSVGDYDSGESTLALNATEILIAVGDTPEDPVTGSPKFTDGEKSRDNDYTCPSSGRSSETEPVPYVQSGEKGYRIDSDDEGAPSFPPGPFDEPG